MRDWPTHGLQIDLGVDSHLGIPDQVDDPFFTLLGRQVQPRRQVAIYERFRWGKVSRKTQTSQSALVSTHVISILL
jgi:hypothetical protein